jgi:hypothetical protein
MTQITSPDHLALVDELVNIQAAMSRLGEREAEIKDFLRELDPGKHEAGVHTLTITPNRRLDEAKVEAAYPVETNQHLYKRVVNTPVFKALVEPAVYDAMLVEVGKAKISVK